MDINNIKTQLKEVNSNHNSRDTNQIKENLSKLKRETVQNNNQDKSKEIWSLEQILTTQDHYINAFNSFKSERYYEGWCSLEKAEIGYGFIHNHFKDNDNEYWLKFINKHIKQFQSLFPYEIFMSPEFLVKESKCNICDQVIKLRNPCEHIKGEIYDGKMCVRQLTNVKCVGMSAVTSPVQKYSVVFLRDSTTGETIDQYDYSFVKWVIERLQSPFHNWDMVWTKKRHHHSKFSNLNENDKCPCESGKRYKDCCLQESGVIRPHCQIIFSKEPPNGLSNFDYF